MKSIINKYAFSIWSRYFLTTISVLSFAFWFLPEFPEDKQFVKYIIGIALTAFSVISFVLISIYQAKCNKIHLKINNTNVNIIFGDIFKEEGIKVIAFNEYFDTQVDNIVISHDSLNGHVIDDNLIDKNKFDESVRNDNKLIKAEVDSNREIGKKQKYKIGQIHRFNENYFALAFTKFNEKNEAYLYSCDYASCLIEMWKQLNTYYCQSAINIPLLGDGITRMLDNTDVTKQELLEMMLHSLNISKMTFKQPAEINIVLWPGKNNENYKFFDFSRIKMLFKQD